MSHPRQPEFQQYCCNDLKSYALAMPAVSTYHAIKYHLFCATMTAIKDKRFILQMSMHKEISTHIKAFNLH